MRSKKPGAAQQDNAHATVFLRQQSVHLLQTDEIRVEPEAGNDVHRGRREEGLEGSST
jgi:hypothetical protein